MAKKPFYITTSIIYANSKPHIGFALELLQADAIARWHRLLGEEVYFLTGTDEHGLKIHDTAVAAGLDPQTFVDQNAAALQKVITALDISNTDFIRTTDRSRHWPTAQKVWQQLAAQGDITAGHYQGYYSVVDEAYITKTDFESGSYDPTKIVELSEDNYVFDLAKYQVDVVSALEGGIKILPRHRATEMINFAKPGLQSVSFSRPKDKLSWGVPVPGDDSQVMYVWCDALTNYISALGSADSSEAFKKFWPADVQVLGKDILRFHALTWPGMLLGLGLPLPKTLLVHGHILSEGQKMSKSLGNVVDPLDLIDKLGVDPVRYYLLAEIPTQDDGDFSFARFEEVYTANLANDLGNLLNRTLVMADKYLPDGLPVNFDDPFETSGFWTDFEMAMDNLELDKAATRVWQFIRQLNQYVDIHKPWELAKTDPAKAGLVIAELIEALRHIGLALHPFVPQTAAKIYGQLGLAAINEQTDSVRDLNRWGSVFVAGHRWQDPSPIFPKVGS